MVIDERITAYLHSLENDDPVFLEEMREYARINDVPIIRREMESFIRVILSMISPETILEIGTGIAYSAIYMAHYCEAHITTIENYSKRIDVAKNNIERYARYMHEKEERHLKERIKLVEGDASDVIKTLDYEYDFIFLDAAKAQYIEMLPDILKLLKKGGVLLSDNVLQDGAIIDSRFVTERRQRTIHERMREFLYEVKHNEMLDTSIVTIGDGVSLSVKK